MNETRQITTISLDGDATLWDFEKVMRYSLSITLAELRHRVCSPAASDLTVEKMIEIRNAVAAELKGKIINLEEIRLQAFRRTIESVGFAADSLRADSLATDLNALYLKHRFEDIELYPDVIPALDALCADFCVGLLSNGNSYPDRCGLSDRFSFVVFSQNVGFEKPHPAIFIAVCQQARCAPAQLIHVGDSLESDVAGANAVGAVSVWLNRSRIENETSIVPDHEIRSLAELNAIAGTYRYQVKGIQ
jgi:putative hydrolase of the HAD superfamily